MNYEQTLEAIISQQSKLIDEMMTYMGNHPNGEDGRIMVQSIGHTLVICRDLIGDPARPKPDTYADLAEDYVLQVKGQNLD